jgi:hypothetical protein
MEQAFTRKENVGIKADNVYMAVEVITAMWALAEAALGGVLHAMHIPLTGLFVNSCAVVFMVLIASASDKKGVILRATLIVMIVKGMVSPHTPLTAYIAVGFQGLMGELLLRSKKHLLFSSVILGIITLLQSAMQKIIILTVVYGNNLWETIDIFVNFILAQMPFFNFQDSPVQISFWLISVYIGVHLLAGIAIGIIASKIPNWIRRGIRDQKRGYQLKEGSYNPNQKSEKIKRKLVQKPSAVLITILAGSIVVFSYLFPEISESQGMQAVIMILRSTAILFIWYSLIGPFFLKLSQNYFRTKQNKYATEIQRTLNILVPLRYIVYQTWNESQNYSYLKRIKIFIKNSLITIFSTEFYSDEKN